MKREGHNGAMISLGAAQELDQAGVVWRPEPGDRFTLRSDEFEGEVFTVAEMVVEARHHATGTVLAFNGTTEWALDSVQLAEALWLPREDQLRELLAGAFRSLTMPAPGAFAVRAALPGHGEHDFHATAAADAYALALLALVRLAGD